MCCPVTSLKLLLTNLYLVAAVPACLNSFFFPLPSVYPAGVFIERARIASQPASPRGHAPRPRLNRACSTTGTQPSPRDPLPAATSPAFSDQQPLADPQRAAGKGPRLRKTSFPPALSVPKPRSPPFFLCQGAILNGCPRSAGTRRGPTRHSSWAKGAGEGQGPLPPCPQSKDTGRMPKCGV